MPVSEEVTLRQCNHFIAAIDTSTVVDEDSAYLVGDVESMCVPHELAVVYTVAEGDCAVDTMCVMVGAERSRFSRDNLRNELSAYLLHNAEHTSLQNSLQLTQLNDPADIEVPKQADTAVVSALAVPPIEGAVC